MYKVNINHDNAILSLCADSDVVDLWKSSCDLPYFTAWNDAFYRVICPILHDDMTQIISSFNAICNVFIVQRWRRCTYYSLRLASAYLRLCMIKEINAVSVMPAFQWMYLATEIPSWCNAVGVVLLIAQGWRAKAKATLGHLLWVATTL